VQAADPGIMGLFGWRRKRKARRGRHRRRRSLPTLIYPMEEGMLSNVHLSAHELGQGGSGTTIRHVSHVDAGHHPKNSPAISTPHPSPLGWGWRGAAGRHRQERGNRITMRKTRVIECGTRAPAEQPAG